MYRKQIYILIAILVFLSALPSFAADPQQVILWPDKDHPVLRFTFDKFKDLSGSVGKQHPYASLVTAENLSSHKITSKHFLLYAFDKKQIRVSDGWMDISNLAPGQAMKFQVEFMATGTPSTLQVVDQESSPKLITLTVNSIPQGAELQIDGKDAGTTPKLAELGAGKHQLSFSKNGFKSGVFPLEVGPNDVSGGSVSYELGAALFDTVELRDGTVLNGDLDSILGMEISVRIGGQLQKFDRNKVKRILLVPRSEPEKSTLPAAIN